MRNIIAPAAAALIICTGSGAAFAKGHSQPSSTAQQLGQANAAAVEEDGTLAETGARNADAKGADGTKGVDGKTYSDTRSAEKGSDSGLKSGDMTLPN